MRINLQFFGGRGASAGGGSSNSVSLSEVLNSPQGSKIAVQEFSAITGKPTGGEIEYTLSNGWWSSVGYGSFRNNTTDINKINSINGTIPKIRRIK